MAYPRKIDVFVELTHETLTFLELAAACFSDTHLSFRKGEQSSAGNLHHEFCKIRKYHYIASYQ
jgi:hypothetical protein